MNTELFFKGGIDTSIAACGVWGTVLIGIAVLAFFAMFWFSNTPLFRRISRAFRRR